MSGNICSEDRKKAKICDVQGRLEGKKTGWL